MLLELNEEIAQTLHAAGHEQIVLGEGDPHSAFMLIGEAPGKEEIAKGRPFVGKAGRNLDRWLETAGLSRNQFYITNTVKFRPCVISEKGTVRNRPPTRKERELCAIFLHREIQAVAPALIVTLGSVAFETVSGRRGAVGNYHGHATYQCGNMVFALYHPASVIYNRELEPVCQADLVALGKYIRALLEEGGAV